jgi:hypothetical protein
VSNKTKASHHKHRLCPLKLLFRLVPLLGAIHRKSPQATGFNLFDNSIPGFKYELIAQRRLSTVSGSVVESLSPAATYVARTCHLII